MMHCHVSKGQWEPRHPLDCAEVSLSAMASDVGLLDGGDEAEPGFEDDDWDVEWGDIMANMNGANGRARARQSAERLEEVAAKAGLGKMYAAFGGGEDGLSACAAGTDTSLDFENKRRRLCTIFHPR